MRAGLAGILAKGAIAAVVAAERGKGDENLFGEGDGGSLSVGAEFGCEAEEFAERGVVHQLESCVAIERSVERGSGLE